MICASSLNRQAETVPNVFTGIVQSLGRVVARSAKDGDLELAIAPESIDLTAARVGDSVAVNGACLTMTRIAGDRLLVDVSRETLAHTTLGSFASGRRVNLELALRAGDPLGGHLVSGHVDGTGTLVAKRADARSQVYEFEVSSALARYIARKGSVCLDGVSLTVNEVTGGRFTVNLIPHTQQVTTLGELAVGDKVNVEVDLIARYIERLLRPPDEITTAAGPDG
jgi:riboflavin synthase